MGDIRDHFAPRSGAGLTDPAAAGIFVSIAAWAGHQRARLEAEGHSILCRGHTHPAGM
ncbi:hypothetical protein [Lawsonibacter hominis]|uniref:hypothetical protein n=1 Tax=Lawsonibacter hominis TaxID=2763053 RepID=UPI00350F25E9